MSVEDLRTAVMEQLSWNGPLSVTELADILNVAPARIRSVVAKLHQADLVEGYAHTNAVQLTNKG